MLFTVNEVDQGDEPGEPKSPIKKIKKDLKKKVKNKLEEQHPGNAFRETIKISFPNNQGITGEAFQAKQVIIHNNMTRVHAFQSDIDNQTNILDVKNIMIGPVFPHAAKIDGDPVGVGDFDRKAPIGILQLINKNEMHAISDFDVKKF